MTTRATRDAPEEEARPDPGGRPTPGLVAIFNRRPICVALAPGARVGRDALAELGIDDDRISRDHFELEAGGGLHLVDLGSRNGTFVDGARAGSRVPLAPGAIVRAGDTLFVATNDRDAFVRTPTTETGGVVSGPTTRKLLARATALGRLDHLLVTGESGVGEELVARAFHVARAGRPFVAVNCATIPVGIAERLLFGARRGAFTGAEQDADGFVRAAQGGTLFLDEVGELDRGVQAKLLRFLETREYFPVGEARPAIADVKVCCATLRDLASEVAARRFRDDLYHRIASPALEVAPLSTRRDEIPFLIESVARRTATRVTYGLPFVERAARLVWPGHVRQLLRSVEAAFAMAEADGRASVDASDLADLPDLGERAPPASSRPPPAAEPSDEEVRHAMEVCGGNVSMAARALGVHRSKLRRALGKLG